VVSQADVLPDTGPGSGKGNAMWKSLDAASGDLVCWIDADIRNFRAHFVTGLLGPLLRDPETVFVKGFYQRPFHGERRGGGRVTELVARPLISTLFPPLAGFVQPLSGEYAGRREALEELPFVEGWGVEFGLLVEVVERYGIDAIAQVDLGVREHRNRTLEELGPQATAILVTALRRAGLSTDRAPSHDLVRFDASGAPLTVPVEVRERPPIITVPAYRAHHNRELTAS
jgi:glucosyl-3-phosphoglycerate synthase